jgi:hypothetical protein
VLRDQSISGFFFLFFELDGDASGPRSGLTCGGRSCLGFREDGRVASSPAETCHPPRSSTVTHLQYGRRRGLLYLDHHVSLSREGDPLVCSPPGSHPPARRGLFPSGRLKTALVPSKDRKEESEEWGRQQTFSPPYTQTDGCVCASIAAH